LTALGKRTAEGRITQSEFAAIIVQQTVLPNPWTYSPDEIAKWESAGLKIRPLSLILEIMEALGKNDGQKEAYLTPNELMRVVIPLAGQRLNAEKIADFVGRFRADMLDVSKWPDCVPEANDHRLAREFLLFLTNFGFCRKEEAQDNLREKYRIDEVYDFKGRTPRVENSIFNSDDIQEKAVETIISSSLPSIVERQRSYSPTLKRPEQNRFRLMVLTAYESRCLITGERITEVLEAAHIIPVTHNGADTIDNGLCLRVDLHRLFDAGHIRIKPSGEICLSDAVSTSHSYSGLPKRVQIPRVVNQANVKWRDDYL
jgi:hypothetical protein